MNNFYTHACITTVNATDYRIMFYDDIYTSMENTYVAKDDSQPHIKINMHAGSCCRSMQLRLLTTLTDLLNRCT